MLYFKLSPAVGVIRKLFALKRDFILFNDLIYGCDINYADVLH